MEMEAESGEEMHEIQMWQMEESATERKKFHILMGILYGLSLLVRMY